MFDFQKAAIDVLSKPGRHVLYTRLGEGATETVFRAIAAHSKEVTIVCPTVIRDFLYRVALDEGLEDVTVLSPARIRLLCTAEAHWQKSDRPTVVFKNMIPVQSEATLTARAIASFVASRNNLIIVEHGDWKTEEISNG